MSLVPPILDDRHFDDLTAEALKRIRLACPDWTDFNPADPGITLVELFAWFTELMLFRMNKVPDKLHGELLSLVGIMPEPAKAARAMIEFTPLDNCPSSITGGTSSISIDVGADRPLKFQTTRDLAMVRRPMVAIIRKLPGEAEEDLTKLNEMPDRGFDPFGTIGASNSELILRIKAASPDMQAADVFPDVLTLHVSQMKRGRTGDFSMPEGNSLALRPQTPPLSWSARIDGDVWEPLEVIDDATKGFECDGFIRIAGPRRAVPIANAAPSGAPGQAKRALTYVFELRCLVGGAGFAFASAPRFLHVALNAVDAIALTTETEDLLGTSTGLEGQVFSLRNRPVDPDSVKLATGPANNEHLWSKVDDFFDSLSTDTHFTVDGATGEVRFGDNSHGQVPGAGVRVVAKSYQAGGGIGGNVGAKQIKIGSQGASGTNPFPAIDGSNAEQTERLRQRAASRLRSRDRAVTCADFEELALRKGQMGRARAIAQLHPDFPELSGKMPGVITVFVVGKSRLGGDLPPWPSDAEIGNVKEILDRRRMVGAELFVRAAMIVPVKVTMLARASAGYAGDEVRGAIRRSLNDWLNSSDRGFATQLYAADLWSCAAQTTIGGVRVIDQVLSLRADVNGRILEMAPPVLRGPRTFTFVSTESVTPEKNTSNFIAIADQAILWGRPDHIIQLEGATPS